MGHRPDSRQAAKDCLNVIGVNWTLLTVRSVQPGGGRVRLKHHFLSCVEFPFVNTTASSAISGQQVVTREGVWDT